MRPLLAALLTLLAAQRALAQPAPLTLDDALALAARANADLLQARAEVDVSRADRMSAYSAVLPRLDLSGSFGRSYSGATGPRSIVIGGVVQDIPAQPSSDGPAYSLGAQLTQTVFDWSSFHNVEAAGWSARAAERQYDEAALSVSFEVTRRFYDLVKQERSLTVLEKTAARSQELVERADALFTAGRAPKSDTYTARVNLQSDRIGAEAQRIQVAQARSALAQTLGGADPGAVAVVPPAALDAPGLPSGEPPTLEALLARARERRPTLAAQEAAIRASSSSVGAAQGGYLPEVSLQGSYSRAGQILGGAEGVYGDPSRAYDATAQVVLSWNVFEGRATVAAVRRAEATLARARAARQRTQETVSKEIADARAAVVGLARQVSLASDSLGIARDALALATQRFDAGLASQLEVRDANLKLAQAELTLIQTRIDHAVAQADLSRAVGGPP
jgi:outer membrane protein TolC